MQVEPKLSPVTHSAPNDSEHLAQLIANSPLEQSALTELLINILKISKSELAQRQIFGKLHFSPRQTSKLIHWLEQLHSDPNLPVQHLTGSVNFAGIELQVGPGVFIPRPETELLLELLPVSPHPSEAQNLLDLCAGSGAIGLAFKQRYPKLSVDLVENSPTALRYLRRNINYYKRQSPGDGIKVINRNMLNLLTPRRNSANTNSEPELRLPKYNYIVSNPPYIPQTETITGAAAYDPPAALFSGPQGLDLIASIIENARNLLKAQGVLLFEHHSSQRTAIVKLFKKFGWSNVQTFDDLSGLPRFARAENLGPKSG
jgi:release factor glutamine methyltransferase